MVHITFYKADSQVEHQYPKDVFATSRRTDVLDLLNIIRSKNQDGLVLFSTVRDSAIAAVSDAEDLEDADEPQMIFHRYKLLQRLSAGPISRAHAILHLEA
ncbi:hypothetical protein YC2023_107416 [Brassica napus]